MATDTPPTTRDCSHPERRQPRANQPSVAFIRRLDGADVTPLRANLVDRSADGLAVNAMIPLAVDSRIVVNITEAPARQVLLLGRVVHCTKLKSGRYQIGVTILDRQEGNLHTTPIPDAWRHP
jgi:hypothetical protein